MARANTRRGSTRREARRIGAVGSVGRVIRSPSANAAAPRPPAGRAGSGASLRPGYGESMGERVGSTHRGLRTEPGVAPRAPTEYPGQGWGPAARLRPCPGLLVPDRLRDVPEVRIAGPSPGRYSDATIPRIQSHRRRAAKAGPARCRLRGGTSRPGDVPGRVDQGYARFRNARGRRRAQGEADSAPTPSPGWATSPRPGRRPAAGPLSRPSPSSRPSAWNGPGAGASSGSGSAPTMRPTSARNPRCAPRGRTRASRGPLSG